MLSSWEINSLSTPEQLFAFSRAYLKARLVFSPCVLDSSVFDAHLAILRQPSYCFWPATPLAVLEGRDPYALTERKI